MSQQFRKSQRFLMNDNSNEKTARSVSAGKLVKNTIIAAIVAFLVTVLFVLPAEFGVDPTGVGQKLGLMDLGDVDSDAGEGDSSRTVVGSYPDFSGEFDYYEPEVLTAPFSVTHDGEFRSDTLTIDLKLGEEVEYKALMKQGDAIVYSWRVDNGDVYTDFHADPGEAADGYPEGFFIRYSESETNSGAGSLVAPFSGNHGWYWLNIQDNPIQITLEVRGYYESVTELYRAMQ
jgi:hypothetical protein